MFKPSTYQLAIFDDIATGSGHTIVNAVAGSGKTTTLLKGLEHVPRGLSMLFVAFNKAIAEELKARAPSSVEVMTLHSYGFKTVMNGLGRLRFNERRIDGFYREIVGNKYNFQFARDFCQAVGLAKGCLMGEEQQIETIIDEFEIDSGLGESREDFIKMTLDLLHKSSGTEDGCLDYDDMVWMPVVHELRQRQFDRVFVDETQDLNAAQIELVMRSVKPNGRICAVGDPRQAIYRFRGADENAFAKVRDRLNAKVLPLSVCYRCAKSIVAVAKEIVSDIEAAPDADMGEVDAVSFSEMKGLVRPGDFILSRTNAPLVGLCMYFLKNERKATIQGRDIGASLAAFVRKSKAKTVDELRTYVEEWCRTECKRLAEKRRNTQAVEDRAECILALSEGADTVASVLSYIETMFKDLDDTNAITLSTTHRAKGLERDRAFVLRGTYMRVRFDGDVPSMEEENLLYVALTRARKALFLVMGKK